MALTLIITDAGRAAMVDQANGGTRAVRIAAVGVSPTATNPTATATTLPDEVRRITTIAGEASAADVVHLTVQDESDSTYTVRSFALYLADGTLFAIYGQPAVIVQKSTQSVMLLAIDVKLASVPAGAITFGSTAFINPPATVDRPGVVELATNAEAEAATDTQRALTPANIAAILSAAKILQRLLTVDGGGSGLDADMVDGRHAAEFALLLGAAFKGAVSIVADTGAAGALRVRNGTGATSIEILGDAAQRLGAVGLSSETGSADMRISANNALELVANGVLSLVANGSIVNVLTALRRAGATVWDAANDGAGSGADADMLDGQQGGWYADIPARLGFAPLAASSYTAADILAKLVGVDGGGSGLDADTVDGRQAAEFALLLGAAFKGAVSIVADTGAAGPLRVRNGTGATSIEILGDGGQRYGTVGLTSEVGSADMRIGANNALGLVAGGVLSLVANSTAVNVLTALRRAGSTVWDAANDGAGSGLDADMLDGRQGGDHMGIGMGTERWWTSSDLELRFRFNQGSTTYIAGAGAIPVEIRNRDGFQLATFGAAGGLNTAGPINAQGGLVWHAANDGAGSGADADLLDGQQGSWYADVPARLGFTPLPASSYTAADVLAKAVTVDGAGSGLDADMLDGYHAADFVRTSASRFDNPGYRQHSDGFIEQWGEIPGPITARGNRVVEFAMPFPNRCLGIEAIAINSNSVTSGGTTTIQRVTLSRTDATLRAQNEDSAITDCAGGISWRAWGY